MKRGMLFLAAILCAPLLVQAEALYTVKVLGSAGSVACAVNESGQVVDLGNLGGTGSNDAHQIAGTACKGNLCYAVRLDLASAVPEPELGRVARGAAPWRRTTLAGKHGIAFA